MARTVATSPSRTKNTPKGNRWRMARRMFAKTVGNCSGPSSMRWKAALTSRRKRSPSSGRSPSYHFCLLGVELGLRPNDQSGHLPIVAESGLYPLDDFPPRAGLARGLLMCRKPLTQERLLPLMEGHLVDGRRDGIPERLHVIDLFVHR